MLAAWLVILFSVFLVYPDLPNAPRELSAKSKRSIQAPNFPSYGEPLCDGDGNLFFHLANGMYDNPEIAEISNDGTAGASFKLPPP